MLVVVVDLLNVSMHVFVSMVLVSLHMEILLISVTPFGLRCSLISLRKHDERSGDFITAFEKFRVGWGYVFMFSFLNYFHFSIFSDCFSFVVGIIMVLSIALLILIGLQCVSIVFELGMGIVWWWGFLLLIQVQWIDRSFHQFHVHFLILRGVFLFFWFLLELYFHKP